MTKSPTANILNLTVILVAVLFVGVGLFAAGVQMGQTLTLVMGVVLIGFVAYIIYCQQRRK